MSTHYKKEKAPSEKRRFFSLSTLSRKEKIIILAISLLIVLVLGMVLYALNLLRATTVWNRNTMFETGEYEITGTVASEAEYVLNPDVISVLMLGIDKKGHGSEEYNGQCDAIAVMALNTKTNEMTIISIPRDTMAYITRQNQYGSFTDQLYAQLALAHSYGKNDADSVSLCQRAVSQLLYGVPINHTVQFQVSGVPEANDLVGGVTLTLLEDFTNLKTSPDKNDPSMVQGATLTLSGQQAYNYVQYRDIYKEGSSADRLKRQIQYFKAYFKAVQAKVQENPLFLVSAYNSLQDFLYTNLSMEEMLFFGNQALNAGLSENSVVAIEGEMTKGETYMEFYPDEDALKQLVLDVFFEKKT